MIITWFGLSFFKIETKGSIIAIDPYTEESGLKPPRFKTDILLVSHNHTESKDKNSLMGEYFLLEGPGEIEKAGIFIEGINSYHDNQSGKQNGTNTIYLIQTEDIKLVYLGDLGEKKLRDETLEKLEDIDILIIPIGGKDTIGSEEATSIINQIEPKIVIPMNYKIPGIKAKLGDLDEFIKTCAKKPETLDKLTIKKNDLPSGTKLIVLNKQ
ncbi:MAG: MBL fold metallo-hydrolase [Candidatus Parcubacteria bacterium]|nr:MBL fold metallo-hydrolase [Candidatus Parcubacteria bacterium]